MQINVGRRVPRRGNFLTRSLGRLVLRLLGWRLAGEVPDCPKMVMIGAPHTSNMDGVIAIATLFALGIQASTMIKDSAFQGLRGVALRWLGAIPVNRKSPQSVVEQSAAAFAAHERFFLLIAPEGTRQAAAEWKKGFYRIARRANVPLLPGACDYRNKVITLGPLIHFTDDFEADFQKLMVYYASCSSPRHPERMSRPMCKALGFPWNGGEKPAE